MEKIITLKIEEEELFELACALELNNLNREYIQVDGDFSFKRERSFKEIGDAMGLSESWVQRIFVGAMEKLKVKAIEMEAAYKD